MSAFTRPVAVLRGVVASAIGETESIFLCSSSGCNRFTVTLVDVVDNGDGTVTVTWDRDGDDGGLGAVPTVTTEVRVAGELIDTRTAEWFPGEHFTHTATGPGQAGDAVEIRASTTNFGGDSLTVTGTVPAAFDPAAVVVPSGQCTVSPRQIEPPADVSLSATVDNPTEASVEATVEWRWLGQPLATATVTVAGGRSAIAEATATVDRQGQEPVTARVVDAVQAAAPQPARGPA